MPEEAKVSGDRVNRIKTIIPAQGVKHKPQRSRQGFLNVAAFFFKFDRSGACNTALLAFRPFVVK